jgi:hypothetical protein
MFLVTAAFGTALALTPNLSDGYSGKARSEREFDPSHHLVPSLRMRGVVPTLFVRRGTENSVYSETYVGHLWFHSDPDNVQKVV